MKNYSNAHASSAMPGTQINNQKLNLQNRSSESTAFFDRRRTVYLLMYAASLALVTVLFPSVQLVWMPVKSLILFVPSAIVYSAVSYWKMTKDRLNAQEKRGNLSVVAIELAIAAIVLYSGNLVASTYVQPEIQNAVQSFQQNSQTQQNTAKTNAFSSGQPMTISTISTTSTSTTSTGANQYSADQTVYESKHRLQQKVSQTIEQGDSSK